MGDEVLVLSDVMTDERSKDQITSDRMCGRESGMTEV